MGPGRVLGTARRVLDRRAGVRGTALPWSGAPWSDAVGNGKGWAGPGSPRYRAERVLRPRRAGGFVDTPGRRTLHRRVRRRPRAGRMAGRLCLWPADGGAVGGAQGSAGSDRGARHHQRRAGVVGTVVRAVESLVT